MDPLFFFKGFFSLPGLRKQPWSRKTFQGTLPFHCRTEMTTHNEVAKNQTEPLQNTESEHWRESQCVNDFNLWQKEAGLLFTVSFASAGLCFFFFGAPVSCVSLGLGPYTYIWSPDPAPAASTPLPTEKRELFRLRLLVILICSQWGEPDSTFFISLFSFSWPITASPLLISYSPVVSALSPLPFLV